MAGFTLKQQTEGALLAVIAAVMSLATNIPLLGAAFTFLTPSPIALSAIRHGIKTCLMTVILATILIFLVAGPTQAIFFIILSGGAGALIGSLIRLKFKGFSLFLVGVTLMVILETGTFFIGGWVMGFPNPLEHAKKELHLIMEQSEKITEYLPMPAEAKGLQKEQFALMSKVYEPFLSFPLLFFIAGGFIVFVIHYYVTSKVLIRLGEKVDPLPEFKTWCLPPMVFPVIILLYVAVANYAIPKGALEAGTPFSILDFPVLFNVVIGSQMLFLMLGLSTVVFYMNRWEIPPPLRILGYGIMLIPLAGLTLIIGIVDTITGLRYYSIFGKSEETTTEASDEGTGKGTRLPDAGSEVSDKGSSQTSAQKKLKKSSK